MVTVPCRSRSARSTLAPGPLSHRLCRRRRRGPPRGRRTLFRRRNHRARRLGPLARRSSRSAGYWSSLYGGLLDKALWSASRRAQRSAIRPTKDLASDLWEASAGVNRRGAVRIRRALTYDYVAGCWECLAQAGHFAVSLGRSPSWWLGVTIDLAGRSPGLFLF